MSNKQTIAFTAPHWAATEAGLEILENGGTAVEAMVAAAAVITLVYPHMNSIGGDSFWLIDKPEVDVPIGINACGRSASQIESYQSLNSIPSRGGASALTQAGTIRGWQLALQQDKQAKMSLAQIFAKVIYWAENGFEVSESLHQACLKLSNVQPRNSAFKALYEPQGKILQTGQIIKNPKLAQTFKYLAKHGLDAFYQGPLANSFIKDLQAAGSSLSAADLSNTQAQLVKPLSVQLEGARCFNLPAPTQGIHSLQILAIVNQLKSKLSSEADWTHAIVEASKQSFNLREKIWADPTQLSNDYSHGLSQTSINQLTKKINLNQAKKWPFNSQPGDTVWMGAKDKKGQMISFIQSIYWEFGSGIAMSEGGFVWNNRGVSFSLDKNHINVLSPQKQPAHTLNPAFAKFDDGRRLAYGTMGGEGQPQTQAAIFTNYAWRNINLNQAIAKGRWLLGRTWGDTSTNLKVEASLANQIKSELDTLGHDWQSVSDNNEMMGHAGAIADYPIIHPSEQQNQHKLTIAATDPRSDGSALVKSI